MKCAVLTGRHEGAMGDCSGLVEWLLENAGPVVRYRTASELKTTANPKVLRELRSEVLECDVVKRWLEVKASPDVCFEAVHGSRDDNFENVGAMLVQMGLDRYVGATIDAHDRESREGQGDPGLNRARRGLGHRHELTKPPLPYPRVRQPWIRGSRWPSRAARHLDPAREDATQPWQVQGMARRGRVGGQCDLRKRPPRTLEEQRGRVERGHLVGVDLERRQSPGVGLEDLA